MNLQKFVTDFKKAENSNDPTAMMQAMQDFFSQIYQIKYHEGSKILGLYSTAQQLEVLGLNSKVIRLAIRAHVAGQYQGSLILWRDTVHSLNFLLLEDKLPVIK